jgi:hypothetical protein
MFALSGFFGIISVGEDVEPQGGMYGGELRVALKSDIQEDPLLANDDASLMAVSLLYDSLARIRDVDLQPRPWVAVNWTLTSNDTVDVILRSDVEWHDSTDENPHYMTATDICDSYNTMKSSVHWGALLQNVVCTAGTDKATFDLTNADQARGVFYSKVLTIPIVGPSNLGSGPYMFGERGTVVFNITGDDVDNQTSAGQRYAIGGAHYHYIKDLAYDSISVTLYKNDVEMTAGYSIDMSNGTISFNPALSADEVITADYDITSKYTNFVAFERHFVARPYLDSINYTFYPDNPATTDFDEGTDGAVKAMVDSLVDFIGFEMTSGSENALRWEGGRDETTLGDPDHVHISVQTVNPKLTLLILGMNTPLNPLNDTQFRKGLSMSIKRELAQSFEASTTIADSMIHPSNTFWHNATCPKFRIQKDQDNIPDLTPIINHFQDEGYLDPDEDGYLEDPTGADFKLSLLVPPTGEDPSKASIGGQAIGGVFNDVGVETETVYLPSDDILDRVEQDNFSLYLSTVDVEADPIFLYDMFHKDGSKNDVNLDEPFLNGLLDNVRTQLDIDVRQYYVKYAVCYIAETAPVGTILHYRVLESYEKVNYEGWVQMTGGVNNFWSYVSVHYQQLGAMKAQIILLVDTIQSGEILNVVVSATDLVDAPLSGAWVKVTNDHNSDVIINYTGSTGQVAFQWMGPNVTAATTVAFTATVRIPQYDEAIAENSITVHPLIDKMLLTVAAQNKNIQSGEETVISIEVVDDLTGIGIPEVTLIITISGGAGGVLGDYAGTTDVTGRFTTTFQGDVTSSVQFTIEVTASKEGYETSDQSQIRTSILVQPESQGEQGLELLMIIIVLIVVLVILVLFLVSRRMRAGGGGELEEEFEDEELEEEEAEEEFEEEAEVLVEE